MGDEQPKAVQEVSMPSTTNFTSNVVKPRIIEHFKHRQSMIQLLHAVSS